MPVASDQSTAPRPRRLPAPVVPQTPALTPEVLADEIRSLLQDMKAGQDRLLEAVREHRAAIARADQKAIGAGLERHRLAIEGVRAIEDRRARLGARVAGRGASGAGVTLGQMLARVPAPERDHLATLGAEVKRVALTAQVEQRALGEASLALAGHIEGLMRGVTSRVSEAGVYGRRGYVESGARPVGVLDVSR